jgi:hypothetical protein
MGNVTLDGKVDTGAELSSMHVDEFNINADMVSLKCGIISNNTFRLPLTRMVGVMNSDGQSEERPVVTIQISINDNTQMNTEFSLNDRSKNQDQVLIGQNILKAGNFVVDPNQDQVKENDEFEVVIGTNPINVDASSEEKPETPKEECCPKKQIRDYLNKISVLLDDLDKEENNQIKPVAAMPLTPTQPEEGNTEATND